MTRENDEGNRIFPRSNRAASQGLSCQFYIMRWRSTGGRAISLTVQRLNRLSDAFDSGSLIYRDGTCRETKGGQEIGYEADEGNVKSFRNDKLQLSSISLIKSDMRRLNFENILCRKGGRISEKKTLKLNAASLRRWAMCDNIDNDEVPFRTRRIRERRLVRQLVIQSLLRSPLRVLLFIFLRLPFHSRFTFPYRVFMAYHGLAPRTASVFIALALPSSSDIRKRNYESEEERGEGGGRRIFLAVKD